MTRRATLASSGAPETLATMLASLGQRGHTAFDKGVSHVSRELKRLQDTKEYAHIDTVPVRYTVWSNGKYVDPKEVEAKKKAEEKAKQQAKPDASAPPISLSPTIEKLHTEAAAGSKDAESAPDHVASCVEAAQVKKKSVKIWLDKGLYAGQAFPEDSTKGLMIQEKKSLAQHPELLPKPGVPVNTALPPPMFNGLRLLLNGRSFKLPFDVCNPLPPGQPKPTQYRTITKNRFVGDASAIWKKTPVVEDYMSKCVCNPENGCDEDCQNRIMLYECDETNCNVGKAHCRNRAFQDLQERTKKGGRYRVGVEVLKTADRGYGVRSNRCFEPNQIIMEYTGEIITEEECERRMNEVYKNNECYYLMSFDQNMIIDATTGSIARFVNHSCSPNCRMIKWVVSGQPRMALFAGDNPIMTGEELTYDYNFDPFSAKNVQKCLCGSPNCRGILGPKPREVKAPREKKQLPKGTVKTGGKRKRAELVKGDNTMGDKDGKKPVLKKRKIATASQTTPTRPATGKGVKRSLTTTSAKVVKGAAASVTRGLSRLSSKTKHPKKTTTKTKTSTAAIVQAKPKSTTRKKKPNKTKGSDALKTVPRSKKTTATKKTQITTVAAQKRAVAAGSGKGGVLTVYGKKGVAKAAKAARTMTKSTLSASGMSPSPSSTIVASGTDPVATFAADPVHEEGNAAASSSRTPPQSGEMTPVLMTPGNKTPTSMGAEEKPPMVMEAGEQTPMLMTPVLEAGEKTPSLMGPGETTPVVLEAGEKTSVSMGSGEKTPVSMAPASASTSTSTSPVRKRTPSRKLLESSSFWTASTGKKPVGVTKKKSSPSSAKKRLGLTRVLEQARES